MHENSLSFSQELYQFIYPYYTLPSPPPSRVSTSYIQCIIYICPTSLFKQTNRRWRRKEKAKDLDEVDNQRLFKQSSLRWQMDLSRRRRHRRCLSQLYNHAVVGGGLLVEVEPTLSIRHTDRKEKENFYFLTNEWKTQSI